MRTTHTFLMLVLALALGAGCAAPVAYSETGNVDGEPMVDNRGLLDELQNGGTFHFEPAVAELSVGARFSRANPEPLQAALQLREGAADVSVDAQGRVTLEGLSLQVSDIHGSVAGQDVTFTDIQVRLAEPSVGDVQWFGDWEEGHATLLVDIIVDWSLLRGETAWPLDSLRLSGLPIEVNLSHGPRGVAQCELALGQHGPFFDWAGTAELSDLSFHVFGDTHFVD
jgi:hypothetical protein